MAGLKKQPCAILVRQGVYKEILTITIPQLYLYGEDPETTVISGNKSWVFDNLTGASSAIVCESLLIWQTLALMPIIPQPLSD